MLGGKTSARNLACGTLGPRQDSVADNREDTEQFGLWELTVWIWEHNPNGIFAFKNPRVP